jgi:hypothetical protein
MRGTLHQAVERVRLLLLAVALLLCAVPTAQAMRCPTPALDSLLSRLNEEAPSPDQGGWYVVLGAYDRGRIGLFVGNNPMSHRDPLGLLDGNSSNEHFFGTPHQEVGPMVSTLLDATIPSFGAGVIASMGAEVGMYPVGVGANASLGGGLFRTPTDGFSVGGFGSAGLILAGPEARVTVPQSPSKCPQLGIAGGSFGAGSGLWISNAGSPRDLGGPFDQWNLNLGFISFSMAEAGGTWIFGATIGAGEGLSYSQFPTTTLWSDGLSLSSGQPIIYR